MTKDEISDLFARQHGGPRLEEASDLVAEARRIMREHYLAADVGITGANFLIAETGSAITVTNEGNAELTQGLPRTHIVVASLEKVVPDGGGRLHAAAPARPLRHRPGVLDLHDGDDRPEAPGRPGRARIASTSCCSTTAARRCWAASCARCCAASAAAPA